MLRRAAAFAVVLVATISASRAQTPPPLPPSEPVGTTLFTPEPRQPTGDNVGYDASIEGYIYPPRYQRGTPQSEGEQSSFGIRRTKQRVDRDQIETFLRDLSGIEKGPIEESEMERYLRAFSRKYRVFIPDRDVLLTSRLDRKALTNALQNSLLKSPTEMPEMRYQIANGQMKYWRELTPVERMAMLQEIRTGQFFNPVVQPEIGKIATMLTSNPSFGRPGSELFSETGQYNTGAYDPNGNQKWIMSSSGPRQQMDLSYRTSPQIAGSTISVQEQLRPLGIPVANTAEFMEFGPDWNDIDMWLRSYYSNGRPRFDKDGNELHANGRRKFSDSGMPLYSNGRPRYDGGGQPLHSNGRRKETDDGRPLFANGRARISQEGRELYPGGQRRWTDDGLGPNPGSQALQSNRTYVDERQSPTDPVNTYAGTNDNFSINGNQTNLPSDATAFRDSGTIGDTRWLQAGGRGPEPRRDPFDDKYDTPTYTRATTDIYSSARQLYANGRPRESDTGVKLHANARKRFSGDGIGASPFELDPANQDVSDPTRPPPAPREVTFEKELYTSGRSAFNAEGTRLYSNARPRSNDRGEYLYSNNRRVANDQGKALTPSGSEITPTFGYQGRAQGKYLVYEVVEGAISKTAKGKVSIQPRGGGRAVELAIESVTVLPAGQTDPVPGDPSRLAVGMQVKAVRPGYRTYVDGALVEDEMAEAAPYLLTNHPGARATGGVSGDFALVSITSARLKRLEGSQLAVQPTTGGNPLTVQIGAESVLLRKRQRELLPADMRQVRVMPGSFDLLAVQAASFKNGKRAAQGAPLLLAVIER